jgi:predicted phosphodiesterase
MLQRKLRVLSIGDAHAPWVKEAVTLQIYEAISTKKYDVIIQMGDLYDMYAFSKFARSHDICTPKEEVEQGFEWARNFWKTIQKLSPKSRKIQIKGNHDDRLAKRVFERFPEAASILMRAEHSLFDFPNVETVHDSRDGIEIEGVLYMHGYMTKIGDHARDHFKPVVHGHSHRGGAHFFNLGNQVMWELDCGFMGDKDAVPLQYGPTKHKLWTYGYGEVDAEGPRFVPLTAKKPKIIMPAG